MIFSRLYAMIAAGVVLVLAVALAFHFWQKSRSQALQNRVSKGQAEASIESGAEATNTIGNVMAADKATDAAVKEGIDEVRSAAEGDRGLASQRAACRLRAYVNSERCARLRAADTGKPAPAR